MQAKLNRSVPPGCRKARVCIELDVSNPEFNDNQDRISFRIAVEEALKAIGFETHRNCDCIQVWPGRRKR